MKIWLRGYLQAGSRAVEDITREAEIRKISASTLKRAKHELGVESVRRGETFHWRDPDVLEEQQGSPNLVAAIQELTKAVRMLAAIEVERIAYPSAPMPLQPANLYEVWSEGDYEEVSRLEIERRLDELMSDQQRLKEQHGKNSEGKLGELLDYSVEIQSLQVEIERAKKWLEKKPLPPPTRTRPF